MEISCKLTAGQLGRQRERWLALGPRRELTADGLRLTFEHPDPDELRELVAIERECCAWAEWRLEGDAVVVSSTGHGVAALHGMFA